MDVINVESRNSCKRLIMKAPIPKIIECSDGRWLAVSGVRGRALGVEGYSVDEVKEKFRIQWARQEEILKMPPMWQRRIDKDA